MAATRLEIYVCPLAKVSLFFYVVILSRQTKDTHFNAHTLCNFEPQSQNLPEPFANIGEEKVQEFTKACNQSCECPEADSKTVLIDQQRKATTTTSDTPWQDCE